MEIKLNKFQQEAVNIALKEKLFLIHGPFGTGKTTVLVEIIKKLVKKGKRVLVTADSNNAVDNVLEKLSLYEESIVRIGNLSKVSERASKYYLDNLIEKDELYGKLREIKEKMEKTLERRDKFLKPRPSLRRGLSEKEILRLAFLEKGSRGVDAKTIKSMANWIRYNREYEKLKEEYDNFLNKIISRVIKNSKVVLTTNSSSALDFLKDEVFDYLIHDEASQSTEPSSIIPLIKCRNAIFAGDHKQLPPTVICEENYPLKLSLFERLIKLGKKSYQLRIQYRMNKLLMEFPNRVFYNNTLIADKSVENIVLSDLNEKIKESEDILVNDVPLVFIDTFGKEHEKISFSKSKYNVLEINIVKNIVEKLSSFLENKYISVISPYKEQVNKLKEVLKGFEVSTIDGFQGRENEVVILSLVRSNKEEEIGFLKDYRRLNVAITRAKRKLIIIGDSTTLETDKIYKKLIDFIKKKGFYFKYTDI